MVITEVFCDYPRILGGVGSYSIWQGFLAIVLKTTGRICSAKEVTTKFVVTGRADRLGHCAAPPDNATAAPQASPLAWK